MHAQVSHCPICPFLSFDIYTQTHRHDSLSLWAIPLKCPLSSFSPWIWLRHSPSGQVRQCVVLNCSMLKSVLAVSPLRFAQFSQNSFFINTGNCNTIDTSYSNHSSDDIQYRMAVTITWFKSLANFTQNQIPLRYTLDLSIVPQYPPSAPRILSKSNLSMCLPLPEAGITKAVFPRIMCNTGTLFPSILCKSFD